jgi:hypothetical protein
MSMLSPLHRKRRVKATPNPNDPQGFAICDGCGFQVPHNHLRERMDFRGGNAPVGLGLWVCGVCDDVPQPYYQKQVLPPDPIPLVNPRPPSAAGRSSGYGYLVTSSNGGNFLVTTHDTWDWSWIGTVQQ